METVWGKLMCVASMWPTKRAGAENGVMSVRGRPGLQATRSLSSGMLIEEERERERESEREMARDDSRLLEAQTLTFCLIVSTADINSFRHVSIW